MSRRDTCGFCGHARMWHPGLIDHEVAEALGGRRVAVLSECVGDIPAQRCGQRCSQFVEVVHKALPSAQVVN